MAILLRSGAHRFVKPSGIIGLPLAGRARPSPASRPIPQTRCTANQFLRRILPHNERVSSQPGFPAGHGCPTATKRGLGVVVVLKTLGESHGWRQPYARKND